MGHRFNPEKANKLVHPDRFEKLPPEDILREFGVKQGDKVADLGSGNGFFTLPIAKLTDATTYALDIEQKMLDMLRERAEEEQVTNIEYVLSDLDTIKLKDHEVDHALISFVLHEVPNLSRTLSEIKRIVKPGGTLIAIEWEAIEEAAGPPLHERIHSNDLKDIFEKNGLRVVKAKHQNPSNYIIAAQPE